jgi:EAL domain-containing protein (putative c-di-GMP-specific phosphodiesterase class I)
MRDFRAALCSFGIGIAYDDFGAGQARLLELSEVPPDFLKFDRSLVKDEALASPSHRALLESLLRHAADAGVATVAEGLESPAAVEACRELGFTHLQGFHLGRPVFADQLPRR